VSDVVRLAIDILPWLHAHPGAHVNDVAAQFGVSRKKVVKVLEVLPFVGPGQFGGELVDVVLDSDGFISVKDAQGLSRPFQPDRHQIMVLMAGLSYLAKMPALSVTQEAEALIEKLSAVLKGDPPIDIVTPKEVRATIEVLKKAISKRMCVDIEYVSGTAKSSTSRRIEPVHLDVMDDLTLVRAYCLTSQGQRSFRADKIKSISKTDQPSTSGLTAKDFVVERQSWPTAEVLVTPDFVTAFDSATIESRKREGDRIALTVRVVSYDWLVGPVMAAGGQISVVSPLEACQTIRTAAATYAARNSE
jgi:proteasome accessory factor C